MKHGSGGGLLSEGLIGKKHIVLHSKELCFLAVKKTNLIKTPDISCAFPIYTNFILNAVDKEM